MNADLLPIFLQVPAGVFRMGTSERDLSALARRYGGTRESYREEAPQHEVALPAFALAATPVTNALYATFVQATGMTPPLHWRGPLPPTALQDHPVVDTNWHEAVAFCQWLTASLQQTSVVVPGLAPPYRFRLPSEAEWERSARGTDGRQFPWGDEFRAELANTRESNLGSSSVVGSRPEGISPIGAHDMAGNVWEWTASLDALYPYQRNDGREDPTREGRRIMRGGCYVNPQGYARCACRFRLAPTVRNEFTGFRLAI
ncbi:formylglycine-generating enzyme family protein [Candidatus Chloroploca asiatica]|uniref:Sulfatase-modifying factor enzyme-like domain-containing protein n=1 Tax=Candidatus Chloroploca asiatica TaxID=1506545 RepID=A0A2H3KPT9_9CHLR|nr:formylglycine-generating enzyme family protein [Candidatus Chloroploca asiatica]PDW00314.1 hypothetical protein A9Q02_09960 [Candidatus Chloroploca asiatica]